MEETSATEIDSEGLAGALASALADTTSAREAYDAGIAGVEEDAQDAHVQAAQVIGRSIDATSGSVANTLDSVEAKVVQQLKKVTDAAQYDHASAVNKLTTAGAAPLYVTADMVADLERDDPVQSAYEQLIAPIVARAADVSDPTPKSGTCPDGYAFDGRTSSCVRVGAVDLPPLPPTDYPPILLPPLSPPPVTTGCQPTCPPPIVYLLPQQQCPEPVSPPASPPPPPECDPTDPDGGCYVPCDTTDPDSDCYIPPVEEAPPPKPVPTETAPEPRPVKPKLIGPLPPAKPLALAHVRDWSSSARCITIAQDMSAPFAPAPPSAPVGGLLGEAVRGIDSALDGLLKGFASLTGFSEPAALHPLGTLFDTVTTMTTQVGGVLAGDGSNVTLNAIAVISAANMAEKYTGAPAPYLTMDYVYDMQYANPRLLPSQENVDAMHLRGVIDYQLWECLTKANGNQPWARQLVLTAGRTTVGIADSISLFRRGEMPLPTLRDYLRANGVISPAEQDAMISATEFIPPYTDLVRFMVRDSADPDVYVPYDYDFQFDKKFDGRIREWAHSQGITDDVMKYIWRAHWQLPSPTQLYEMLHRLRPGRVPAAVATTAEDVRKVLIANDMAPAFVDREMAISYNPITRTDILTFYANGSMQPAEVVQRLMDTGYTEADATRIQQAWALEVANRVANRARVWTRINITKMYRDGGLDRASAKALLLRSIETVGEVDNLLDDVDLMRRAMRVQKCIKAVRRKRIVGEIDELASRNELAALGLDLGQAAEIAAGWTCEITSMSREPLARMVLSWYRDGVIDHDETYRRLINMRYLPDAVERMIQDVEVVERRKQAAAAAAAARRDAADARQALRDAERSTDRAKKRKKCIDEGGNPATC